ncbi:EF-P lysine aminoacylase EpmA [Thermodesulfobacteriota bacterium]
MKGFRQSAIKKNIGLRSQILQAIRRFFFEQNFLEIETPNRIPAPAPETHIEAFASESWFLHTSPELCMKRLVTAGFSRIFQICKCYRQNERGDKHLPELTLLEWYCTETNYLDMMVQTESLIKHVAKVTGHEDFISYQGTPVDLNSPWPRISVADAFDKWTSSSMEMALRNDSFDELMVCDIEPKLDRNRPIFLYDYPASQASLAKLRSDNRLLAERFELYIGGLELCNAFSELTDAGEQRKRFEAAQNARRKSGKQFYPMPEKFLECLGLMPEAAGNALGVDRLVMLFADTPKIDDIVAFTPEEL